MTADMFEQIIAHGAAVNLSPRAKFRLTGSDRTRYLNGQVTNDVRRSGSTETLYACVTDAKGRIAGDVFIHAAAETLLLDAEPGLRETLGMRLERYIVADDVELTDVTEEWQLWHLWGDASASVCKDFASGGQERPHHCLRSNRFGVDGLDVWLPAMVPASPFDCRNILSDSDLETWRILQKIPRWPSELNAATFPPELALEARAMDFTKGCYIGQEVLSRMRTTGKMPRNLLCWESPVEITVGAELHDAQNKAAGMVTSVAKHPVSGRWHVMAMVRAGSDFIAERAA